MTGSAARPAPPSPTPSGAPARRREIALVAAVAALALLGNANVVLNGWAIDADVDIVGNAFVTQPGHFGDLLEGDYVEGAGLRSGYWRPLVLAAYWVLWRAGSGAPFAFLLANVLLNAVAATGVFALARRLGAPALAAFSGAAVFAVHPVHADVVAGVVGLKDLVAGLGVIGGMVALLAARAPGAKAAPLTAAALAAFLAGVLAKESALVLAPCLLALDAGSFLARDRRPAAPRRLYAMQYAGLAAVIALKFGLQRLFLGGNLDVITIHPADNPLVLLPFGERVVQALAYVAHNAALFVWPGRLTADYSYNSLPLVPSFAPVVLAGFALLVLAGFAAVRAARRGDPLALCGLALLVVGYLPTSNLLLTIGTNTAERFLYVPSVGLALLIARGAALPRLSRRAVLAVVLLAVLALGARTVVRNADWRDNLSLWSSAARTYPGNLKAPLNAAQHLIAAGRREDALAEIDRALALDDPDPRTRQVAGLYRPALLTERGAVLAALGRLDEAEAALRDALEATPVLPIRRIRYAAVLNQRGAFAQALDQLAAADKDGPKGMQRAQLEAERQNAVRGLGTQAEQLFRAGRHGEAADVIARALREPGADPRLRLTRAMLLADAGRLAEAEAAFRELLAGGDDGFALFQFGQVMERAGRTSEAVDTWRRALAATPASDPLHATIAARLAGR